MFVLSNFVNAIATLVNVLLTVYIWMIIARAVVSWVSADPHNPIVRFLIQVTEPLLSRIRRVLPVMGGFDLSPIVLLLAIIFFQSFIVSTLLGIARALY